MVRPPLSPEERLSIQANTRVTTEQGLFLDAMAYLYEKEPTKANAIRSLIDKAIADPSVNTPEVQVAIEMRRTSFVEGQDQPI